MRGNNLPHVVMVVPRGEAVRNFLYSDTLRILNENARITLLSVIDDERLLVRFRPLVERIIPLRYYRKHRLLGWCEVLLHDAHFRWLWSEVAKNNWQTRDAEATTTRKKLKRLVTKLLILPITNRSALEKLTKLYQWSSWLLRPTRYFDHLFKEIKPDQVFNCSHIHGPAADLPTLVAHRMGIPTVGFVFSWDNLTSRSRILVPYDYYFVWNEQIKRQLLSIYPSLHPDNVFVTGTPQFDFHSKPEFCLTRDELCRRIGADPERPFVLYTTGIDKHFPEEHRTVELVARLLQQIEISPKPQLVVRTYVKGIGPEMRALTAKRLENVIFAPMLWFAPMHWQENWFTPLYEDLAWYTSLLRHCCLGINPASTVSLELMMHDKPVINLGFDPPGSHLPHHLRWIRHINFDHYRPVAESGAVMVARSEIDLKGMLERGLTNPQADTAMRYAFIKKMFGDTLDGNSGRRVAEKLKEIAQEVQLQKKR